MKAYFSRQIPFFLKSANEMSDDESFDAYPVEVSATVLANCRSIRKLMLEMEDIFMNNPAPEECAKQEALYFANEVSRIFKTKAQHNTKKGATGDGEE